MDIKITAKNIKLTSAIKEFTQARLGRIENLAGNVIGAQVVLSVERKINQKAEITVHLTNKQKLTASATDGDLYKAIEDAVFKIEAQARKLKGKKIAKRVVKKDDIPAEIPMMNTMYAPPNDIRFSVIKQVEVRPMNPEDAAYEMERLGYTFWMFMDEDSKQLNLIFKRLDSTYGLIKPVKKK